MLLSSSSSPAKEDIRSDEDLISLIEKSVFDVRWHLRLMTMSLKSINLFASISLFSFPARSSSSSSSDYLKEFSSSLNYKTPRKVGKQEPGNDSISI